MKTLYHNILLSVTFLLGMVACNKDGEKIIVSTSGAPELVASTESVNLEPSLADVMALSLQWNAIDTHWSDTSVANGSMGYALQLAKTGKNFQDTVTSVNLQPGQTSYAFSVSDLNALLANLGCEPGEETQVDLRLVASLAPNSPIYSNVVSFRATPYVPISYLYVPGDYENWDLDAAEALVSPTSNGIYQGIINFPNEGSGFKVTPARNWDAAYGDAGDGKISLSAGGNIASPGAGNYQLTVNTKENTIDFTPYSWGLIGDATSGGWDTDTDMHYSNVEGLWKITVELTKGEFKFRKDKGWDVSLGGASGILTDGGGNIALAEAGTYEIILNVDAKTYTITKK